MGILRTNTQFNFNGLVMIIKACNKQKIIIIIKNIWTTGKILNKIKLDILLCECRYKSGTVNTLLQKKFMT